MEYIELSNMKDRIIKFGLSKPKRYKNNYVTDEDPWWKIHINVKKPGIEYDTSYESMAQSELLYLADATEKSKEFDIRDKEKIDFMEPDYDFILESKHGILVVNICHADSLCSWLTRDNLDDISIYIKNTIGDNNF